MDLGFEDENDFVSPAKVRRLALKHFFNLAEDHKKLQRLKNIGFDGTKSIVRLAQNQFKPSTDKITVTCQELKIYVDHFLAPNKRGLTTARYLYEVCFHDFFTILVLYQFRKSFNNLTVFFVNLGHLLIPEFFDDFRQV